MYFGGTVDLKSVIPSKSCTDSSESGGAKAAKVAEVSSLTMTENEHNLKETELRLGLPGVRSPVRDSCPAPPSGDDNSSSSATSELCLLSPRRPAVVEKKLFPEFSGEETPAPEKYSSYWNPNNNNNNLQSVKKRVFSEAMEKRNMYSGGGGGGKWAFPAAKTAPVVVASGSSSVSEVEAAANKPRFLQQQQQQSQLASWQGELSSYVSARAAPGGGNVNGKCVVVVEEGCSTGGGGVQDRPSQQQCQPSQVVGEAPASKQQVVGWPPIRSFRCKTLAANPKPTDESEGKPGSNALYIKVSMDGAPYLRKVDLKMYSRYEELSSALEKMFSCFTIGQCGSHGIPGRDGLSESKLMDLLHGSEYVLTYEDRDGDWMLVGDVPWEMFVDSCKRLRIMKGSEAIGLAPRAMEKCKNRS